MKTRAPEGPLSAVPQNTPPAAEPTVAPRCHGTYRSQLTRGSSVPCNRMLGYQERPVRFVAVAHEAPAQADGKIWIRCTRKDCGSWNIFEAAP